MAPYFVDQVVSFPMLQKGFKKSSIYFYFFDLFLPFFRNPHPRLEQLVFKHFRLHLQKLVFLSDQLGFLLNYPGRFLN